MTTADEGEPESLKHSVAQGVVWMIAMPAMWSLGWLVTEAGGIRVSNQFTVFGASAGRRRDATSLQAAPLPQTSHLAIASLPSSTLAACSSSGSPALRSLWRRSPSAVH